MAFFLQSVACSCLLKFSVCHASAANITLSFSYAIQLDLLAKALKLTPGSGQTLTVLPCQPPEVLLPLAGVKAAEVIRKAPLNCALVQLRPGLPVATAAKLELPAGSKYNEVAGALGETQTIQVKMLDIQLEDVRD
jgi:hypothetical protein